MSGPPAAPFIPNMQIPQALPSLPATAPSSAPQFVPPPPTPFTGHTAYNYGYGYNPWPLMQAGYYPAYNPGYNPAYNPGYAPVMPVGYAPSQVPSYWYAQ